MEKKLLEIKDKIDFALVTQKRSIRNNLSNNQNLSIDNTLDLSL